ncbi:hypothetical protein [Alteromonas halophila]|nr:hypothetical protein [Alteromonas halophila]
MTIRSYESRLSTRNVWLFPLLFIIVTMTGHYLSGALHWPVISPDHQRDFNTALGISLLTAVFWAGLRAIHQNVASTLIAILVKRHQLSEFNRHRWTLSRKFKWQLSLCCCLAPLMPALYLVDQGLLPRIDEPGVYMITLTAIPFWLLLLVFLWQTSTNTRYIFALAFDQSASQPTDLDTYKSVFDMAIANARYALGAIAILPVFWFNKPIPMLDMIIVSMAGSVLLIYLFIPVWQAYRRISDLRQRIRLDVEHKVTNMVRDQARGDAIPDFSFRLESLFLLRDQATDFVQTRQRLGFLFSLTWLPLSLFIVNLFERLMST